MRQTTNEDADTAHNARVSRVDFVDNNPHPAYFSTSPATHAPVARRDTRKSSIVGFARGLARHATDMRMFSPPDVLPDHQELQGRQESESAGSMRSVLDDRRERKLSLILPPTGEEGLTERAMTTISVPEESGRQYSHRPVTPQSPSKGSLRERRKVNLDLSLPVDTCDLPAQSRAANGSLSSITPSCPRSPKTPFTRSESARLPQTSMFKASPIQEEDYIGHVTFAEGDDMFGMLPGNDVIGSSQSPKLEHSPTMLRNRGYRRRSRSKRSRSGRSVTSEEAMARTPDGSWSPCESTVFPAQQARTDAKLEQLSHVTRQGRPNRWRWARSTTRSSDGVPTHSSLEPSNRRFSVNPFKRSGRISDHADHARDGSDPPSPPSRFWWIGKQPAASTRPEHAISSTANLKSSPPAFVPAVLPRVATLPKLDVDGDVKGKLADFFFDHTAGLEGKRPKSSPGGYWDSDALLMSYTLPEVGVDEWKEEEEEGPEGPTTPPFAPRGFTVQQNPECTTPGLVDAIGADAHVNTKGSDTQHDEPPQCAWWFRVR
jgi:hypothetical protein